MNPKSIIQEAEQLFETVREHRHYIHSHAELSFEEHITSEYIISVLEKEDIEYVRVAGTGVLAILRYSDNEDAIVLRADIDALPVEEDNTCAYASKNPGVMHACGHDMHAAALLGALKILSSHRSDIKCTIFGLFQPGEELCPGGASLVLRENPFKGYKITAFIGQHIDPDLPTGIFGIREGKYMASGDELRITVIGKGGHAAMPHKITDPIPAAASIISSLQQIVSRNAKPTVPTVLSIGRVIADGATNVIPDKVYMEGTLRTFDEEWRSTAKRRIHDICMKSAAAFGARAEVNITEGYPCVENNTALTRKTKALIQEAFGTDSVLDLDLRTTAEDFGYYTQVYPSVFYRFGAGGKSGGNHSAGSLHTSSFNPDEESLTFAVAGLAYIAKSLAM